MPSYYCHKCGVDEGLIAPAVPSNLTGTTYQLGKFIEHTSPTGVKPVNSVFSDPSYGKYEDYIVSTTASGCLEIDDQNRKNLIWFASEKAGGKFVKGAYRCDESGVKVVHHDDEFKIHGFSYVVNVATKTCAKCGASIPY